MKCSNSKRCLITRIYCNQKYRTKNKKLPRISYNKKELSKWLLSQDKFHILYDNWKYNGFDKNLVPSLDRIDVYKGYSFENIRLVTWEENNKNGNIGRKNGRNGKQNKPVLQFDLNNNFINQYHSINEAIRKTGIKTIGCACRGKYKTAGKFKWRFK